VAHVAIEIVDAGLVVARDGEVLSPSPGIALLDPEGVITGREAAAQARLRPVLAFDRFWSDLTQDPLPRPLPGAGTRADLAFRHLSSVWQEAAAPGDEALFALPGTLRPQEIGLLGGIAAAAAIPVAGQVDAALAACAPLPAGETVLHLDLQLHQAVLTELRGEQSLRRQRVDVAPRVGLRALQSAWAQLVAEAMVRRTRFDPLHQASTEQQLYERMPGWLQALGGSDSVDAEIDASAGRFGVTLRREQFVFAVEAYYAQLFELVHGLRRAGEPVTLALSARAAALPLLGERCAAMQDIDVALLEEGAAARGALAQAQVLSSAGGAALVTALARSQPARPAGPAARAAGGTPPTHVVLGGRAWAIDGEPLTIGLAPGRGRAVPLTGPLPGVSRTHCTLAKEDGRVVVRDHSRHGTWVNGARVSGSAVLAAGDRLRLGTPGVVLELVAAG
jgi:hypothetical protein